MPHVYGEDEILTAPNLNGSLSELRTAIGQVAAALNALPAPDLDSTRAEWGAAVLSEAATRYQQDEFFFQAAKNFAANEDSIERAARQLLDSVAVKRSSLYAPNSYPEKWGFSPAVANAGQFGQHAQSLAGPNVGPPAVWLDGYFYNDVPVPVDFPGAYLGSVPVCLYAQHRQVGSQPTGNSGSHTAMFYAVNASAGQNDVVAVSGRARKVGVPGGVGDAAGVWGSAYHDSTVRDGGVMGMEAHIYQNTPGMAAGDRLLDDWSAGLHVYSDSLGSPAKAGIAIDSSGQTPGRYGFWNAIIIDKNSFAGGGLPGTVGINCGSWDDFNRPEFGIKVGACNWAIYSPRNLTLRGDDSIYFDQKPSGSAVVVDLASTASSLFIVRRNGVDIMRMSAFDGALHLNQPPIIDL